MNKLENLKEKFLKSCQGKFDIFYSGPISDKENCIEFGGDKIEDYLQFAEKLGIKVIYFFEAVADDEESPEHNGEIGQLEVGFLYNNIFHVFTETADWFVKDLEDIDENEEEKTPKEILDKTIDELSNEMIQFLQKEFKDITEIYKNLRQVKSQFWLDKGVGDTWGLDPKTRIKIDKIEYKVEKYFLDSMRKKEEGILPKLIENCVEWCKNQGLTKLTKTNINYFLNENDITLTPIGNDTLYFKVNYELKKK